MLTKEQLQQVEEFVDKVISEEEDKLLVWGGNVYTGSYHLIDTEERITETFTYLMEELLGEGQTIYYPPLQPRGKLPPLDEINEWAPSIRKATIQEADAQGEYKIKAWLYEQGMNLYQQAENTRDAVKVLTVLALAGNGNDSAQFEVAYLGPDQFNTYGTDKLFCELFRGCGDEEE